ncbi:MAG: LysM domain-containing protein [Anaerolineaceae bacterium]|nr:LysM domain-containing protein [Anaerolineaceae bacterium]
MRSPPSAMPPGCFQRLGAIGLMCRMEDQSTPVLDIWAVTRESQGVFLLRVSQSQVDAVQPEGRVAGTADEYVTVCVKESREIEVSMGPGPDGKIHNVNLRGSVHGPVLGTWDTYARFPARQETMPPDAILHVVRYGETLSLISLTYNVPIQSLIERNDLGDGALLRPGQELVIREGASPSTRQLPTLSPQDPRPDGSLVHVVHYGETLSLISLTYNVPIQSLIERNDLGDGALLRPGQELVIREGASPSTRQLPTLSPQDPRPDGSLVHVVHYGETLSLISLTYNVPIQSLIERNDLGDGDLLRPGQELTIRDAP